MLLLALWPAQRGSAVDRFPAPTGYVNDFAHVLTPGEIEALDSYLMKLERSSGLQGAIVTMPTLGDYSIDDAAVRIFEQWGIGKKGKDQGFLILDAIGERKIRIEVGYGLEGALPDGKVGEIRDKYAIPYLRQGLRAQAYAAILRAMVPIALAEIGVDSAVSDSISMGLPPTRGLARARGLPRGLIPAVVILFIMMLQMGRFRRRGLYGGGGPWIFPGMFGGFGGFGGGGGGGGFSGFGGGMSGGGGASGSY